MDAAYEAQGQPAVEGKALYDLLAREFPNVDDSAFLS
jgi:hypothetical protein